AISRELALPYSHVRDRDGALSRRLGVTGTPTWIVFGEHGRELGRAHTAPDDWDALLGPRSAAPACSVPDVAPQQLRQRALGVMGTELLLEALGPDAALLARARDAAEAELRRVEDLMADWRPSPLTRLNDAAGKGPVEVDPE